MLRNAEHAVGLDAGNCGIDRPTRKRRDGDPRHAEAVSREEDYVRVRAAFQFEGECTIDRQGHDEHTIERCTNRIENRNTDCLEDDVAVRAWFDPHAFGGIPSERHADDGTLRQVVTEGTAFRSVVPRLLYPIRIGDERPGCARLISELVCLIEEIRSVATVNRRVDAREIVGDLN